MFKSAFYILIPVFTVTAISCNIHTRQPIYSKPSENNKDYKVEYLFEHDGCKVYRFQDMGNWVYFTSCSGETMTQDSTHATRNRTERKN